jgi:cysteine-rich repeat protein
MRLESCNDARSRRPSGANPAVICVAVAALVLAACFYDWPASRIPTDGRVPECGNGTIEPPEDCDGEDLNGKTCASLQYESGTLACTANCAFDTSDCASNSVCGDSIVAPDEECDDGNLDDDDGCDSACDIEAGWACEGTPSVCTSGCGNGVCHLAGGEDHAGCPDDCGWIQLAAGDAHTCGLKADGTAWCWGDNSAGQLGDDTQEPRLTPVRVGALTGIVAIAAGELHVCAIDEQGHGWCWGDNGLGQLGNGTIIPSATPVPVAGLGSAETLAAGTSHTCATTTAHEAYCWGDNGQGQLGDGSTTGQQTATRVAVGAGLTSAWHITAGGEHSCAVREDATVWCWGNNGQGQLGTDTTVGSPLPVAVDTAGGYPGGSILSAGKQHTCSRDTTGVAWCWGEGANRRLGNGFTLDARSPTLVSDIDAVTSIAAGTTHSCAVAAGGAAWCWGRGTEGQLGAGSTPPSSEPVAVVDATAMRYITAGTAHTCAIMTDGTAWCWGANDEGQLGDSSSQSTDAPVLVDDPY